MDKAMRSMAPVPIKETFGLSCFECRAANCTSPVKGVEVHLLAGRLQFP